MLVLDDFVTGAGFGAATVSVVTRPMKQWKDLRYSNLEMAQDDAN